MSPSKKKRHCLESQDDVSKLSPKKKKMLKSEAEEMDTSEIQVLQDSTVLFELEGNNLNYPPAKKKKKKKKKHRELDDTILENVSEHITEDALTENVGEDVVEHTEENSTEAGEMSAKKKKKKKKPRKDPSAEELLDDEHLNTSHSKTKHQNDEAENDDVKEDEMNDEAENDVKEEEIDTELSFLDTKRMFEDIHEQLTSNKTVSGKAFWEKYKFHPYSSKSCKMAFEKIMSKVQKRRTMLELVNAAGKLMEGTPSVFFERRMKLLKPVTALKIFSQSHYKKISIKHPQYKGIQVLNKLTKKWARLPDQKKIKYIDLALANRPEYMEEVKHCQKIDASFVAKPILSKAEWQIKDRLGGLPDTPPRNGFLLFIQKSSQLYSNMAHQERIKKLSADFRLLPDEVRKRYKIQAKEEKENYNNDLKTYLDSLSPSDLEERSYTIAYKLKKPKTSDSHEIPITDFITKKPPMSGYMLFFRELKDVLKDTPVIQRHVIVSEKWKALSDDERREYNERRLRMQDEWLKKLKFKVNEETTESTSNDG